MAGEACTKGRSRRKPEGTPCVGSWRLLADIYFNGAGVKRDIPLAIRFACESEQAMATLALSEIEKLNGSHPSHERFEFCHYAETTFTMNFCGGYEAEIEADRRTRYYESLKPSMTPEQRAAFGKLLAAENAYIRAHASEVYQGGTIRVIRTLSSQNILENLFHTEIIRFEHRNWPPLSRRQISSADGLARREYERKLQTLRTQQEQDTDEGTVMVDGLSGAEKAWETYRDSWAAFARLRYPSNFAAICAQITLDRNHLLKTIR
jgi:hypothetical protein